jgi:hypothetical protein
MTYCSTYIGDLDHPEFKWEGGDCNGNIPPRLSPVFPPGPAHYHSTFYAWVDKVGVINKQTDFDGWVARVTQPQILDFIEFCYGLEITDAAGWDGKKYILPESELWATLNSNFLDIAVLEWCKLFTDAKAYHNWRKVLLTRTSSCSSYAMTLAHKKKYGTIIVMKCGHTVTSFSPIWITEPPCTSLQWTWPNLQFVTSTTQCEQSK